MRRGVEIDQLVADGAQSLICEQVEMGVAVRMAAPEALARRLPSGRGVPRGRAPEGEAVELDDPPSSWGITSRRLHLRSNPTNTQAFAQTLAQALALC
jgi:hypothetical protein